MLICSLYIIYKCICPSWYHPSMIACRGRDWRFRLLSHYLRHLQLSGHTHFVFRSVRDIHRDTLKNGVRCWCHKTTVFMITSATKLFQLTSLQI